MLIIPAIDLKEGRCVRLSQGRKESVKVYDNDPVAVALKFADSGATLIHVIDLDAAFGDQHSANRAALQNILSAVNVRIEFGGGMRTLEDVRRLIDFGVERVVIGTAAMETPRSLESFVDEFNSRVCVGIDCRNGRVLTHGWQTTTETTAVDLARRVAAAGITRIIYTDTVRDGMLTGPNLEQTIAVAQSSGVKVTVSGGISSLDDIKRVRDADEPLVDSVIIGRALYEQKFTLEEALRVAET